MEPLGVAPNGNKKCPVCGTFNPEPVDLGETYLCPQCHPTAYLAHRRVRPHLPSARRLKVKGKMTPACRTMVSMQGGVCAVCGVPGWGSRDGKEIAVGFVVRAKRGRKVMGMFCRTCAATFQRYRAKMVRYREAGRDRPGPGDQGGSG